MDRGSERKVPHIGTETRSKLLREAAVRNITVQTPTGGSSEEYWSMAVRLNQPSRVKEDGSMVCKLLFYGGKVWDVSHIASTVRISIG